jgi:gamma-glutamylcyclotransferase (GGCT)/AIG2-like uncharacterized protein YtfP
MSDSDVCTVFVYGTLQTGEERAGCWPHAPLAILYAEINAEMYDLGEYPAIIPGHDRVAGEVRQFRSEEMPGTLAVLDEIEGYGQPDEPDLYVRCVVRCRTASGETLPAYTYLLADVALARKNLRVRPGRDGLCRWHRFR